MEAAHEASEKKNRTVAVFNEEDKLKLVEDLTTIRIHTKFCTENNMDKPVCKRWFLSHRTMYGKITHMCREHLIPEIRRTGSRRILHCLLSILDFL